MDSATIDRATIDRATIDKTLANVYRGQKWIVATDVAAGATSAIRYMIDRGASEVMLVAAVEGVGELPDVPTHYTRTQGTTGMARVMDGVRAFDAAVTRPSRTLRAVIDRFDPENEALAIAGPFSVATEIAGRHVYGAKRPEWAALEDKMIAEELWEAAGINHAPATVVSVADAARAAVEMATLEGTVWVADNREGWHGGGDYVRWVRSVNDMADALDWFGVHADRVRVMPFLEGIPCSIHGFVTRDGVAVLRPLEMLVLRRTDRTGFVYAGAANHWDPPDLDRDAMRNAARAVGNVLRDRVGYLGGYGVDGVLTEDGFLPTELNPRLSTGHGIVAHVADLPLEAMARAVVEGSLDLAAAELEATLVERGDAVRGGGVRYSIAEVQPDRSVDICFEEGGAVVAEEENREAVLATARSPQGGIVLVNFVADRMPRGRSVAPLAVAALSHARAAWSIPIPPLEAAPEVR